MLRWEEFPMAKARDVIVILMELSGILYLSIDNKFARMAITKNNSWGRGLNMPLAYLDQIVTVESLSCVTFSVLQTRKNKEWKS